MIKNCVAYSEITDKFAAFDDLCDQINEMGIPKLIIFAAPDEGFDFFTTKFHKAFKKAVIVGVSTYTAFSNKGYSVGGVCALCVYDGIECAAGTLLEITHYPMRYASEVERALSELSDLDNTVCIEFSTAYGKCEELVQDTYRSVLEHKHINVVGGTAGAPLISKKTYVSVNGTVYDEASVFVLIKNLNGRILCYKENLFKPMNHYFTATDVDCDERVVYEYNNRPAADVMSSLLQVERKKLADELWLHPVGRLSGDEIYIAEPDKLGDDGSISYYSRIYNRSKLVLLEADDADKVANRTAADIRYEIESPSMTVVVNCYARTRYFEKTRKIKNFNDKLTMEYGNFVGMSGFGEQINFEHFNMTMVMAVFE